MSFQGYLKPIKEKTGKEAADFRSLANQKGLATAGKLNDGEIVAWLKQDFDLGHGHAMAIYALLKGIKDENSI